MKSLILLIVSIFSVCFISPLLIVYTFLSFLFTFDFKGLGNWFLQLSISIDQFANVSTFKFLNLILIKSNGYSFGKVDETISSVIGKNKEMRTLSKTGILIDKILNLFDSNHSIKSIEYDE